MPVPLVPLIPFDPIEAENNAARLERERKDNKKAPNDTDKCEHCGKPGVRCMWKADCPNYSLDFPELGVVNP